MKYLKQYESYIEMFLDDDDQLILMTEYINEEDSQKVKKLLDSGFDPNTISGIHPIINHLQNKDKNKSNTNILKLFIDHGLNKEIITKFLYNELNWTRYSVDKSNLLEIIRICIKSGADLFYEYGMYDGLFDMIEKKKETAHALFTEKFVNELINIIKDEAPEQYNKYVMKNDSKKFNI